MDGLFLSISFKLLSLNSCRYGFYVAHLYQTKRNKMPDLKELFEGLNPNQSNNRALELAKQTAIATIKAKSSELQFEYPEDGSQDFEIDHIESDHGDMLLISFHYYGVIGSACDGDWDTPSHSEIVSEEITIKYVSIWMDSTEKDYDLSMDDELKQLLIKTITVS